MTLFRTGDILMVLAMLGAGFWTYEIKYEAQQRAREVRGLERKIESERDTAALLRARWALATAPARLERLAAQYYAELQLRPTLPRQIVRADEIPERLPDAIETAIKDNALPLIAGGAGGGGKKPAKGLDNVATAAIRPPAGGGSGGQAPQKKIAAAKTNKPESKRNWRRQPPYITLPAGGFAPAGGGLW